MMNKELDEALCKDFPEIFKDRHADVSTTAMCWGFECRDGWEPLIRFLCEQLMMPVDRLRYRIDHYKKDQQKNTTQEYLNELENELKLEMEKIPVAAQVKEKFGGLRFYVHGASEEQYDMIDIVERMSYRVCEKCGTMKDVKLRNDGWYKTLCDTHATEWVEQRARK